MNKSILSLFLFFSLLALGVDVLFAQILKHPDFIRAYHEDSTIHFEPTIEVNWRDLAPSEFENITDPKESAKRWSELKERRDMFDNFNISYERPLPAAFKEMNYFLISPEGIKPLKLTHLYGQLRLKLSRSKKTIRRRIDSGFVVAEPSFESQDGGFVYVSSNYKPRVTSNSKLVIEELIKNSPIKRSKKLKPSDPLTEKEKKEWQVIKQYTFSLNSDKAQFAFVQWATTGESFESSCSSRYAIVELEPQPHIIATNNYGCDI